MTMSLLARALGLLAALALSASAARADEGMWTFDNFPAAKVEQAYGVKIDQAWLDHVRLAAVRLTSGCSASVVSGEGLVFSNAHCLASCAQALSTPDQDYGRDGFFADTREAERTCPGLQAEILLSIKDVTERVNGAAKGAAGPHFLHARDGAIAAIEAEACAHDPHLRCQVVTLYRGGQFKLYVYRKYSDVRLVFEPEFATTFFGGDPDNFNFPRYNFDVAFLRLYEDGRPVATPDHLTWAARPPQDGEPTFVAGNPGTTDRLLTVAQLENQRDLGLPVSQLQRAELRGRMIRFSEESPENRRLAAEPLIMMENSYKVFAGRLFALGDRKLMAAKRAEEAELKARVAADPKLAAEIGDPWTTIAETQRAYDELYVRYRMLEQAAGSWSDLFATARILVRVAEQRAVPPSERLPEYSEARLPLLRKEIVEGWPVTRPLEQIYLEFWLAKTRETLTASDPAMAVVLGKESPEALSTRLIQETRLSDPAVRQALWDGGWPAIQASDDPLIRYALKLEPLARDIRQRWDSEVSSPTDTATGRVAAAKFAVYGDAVYPDATFTLRLSYGKVAGWREGDHQIGPFTTFGGLWEHATGAEPYQLAPKWLAAKDRLATGTIYDFTTTDDIIGGNSGSPVLNAKGEVIGAAFDGNVHSLGGDYGYDGRLNRTVAVSTAATTQVLDKVYDQKALLKELLGD